MLRKSGTLSNVACLVMEYVNLIALKVILALAYQAIISNIFLL